MVLKLSDILLTGDTGFLGKALKSILDSHEPDRIIGLSTVPSKQANRIDLTLPFQFAPTFSPSLVIHAAGKAHSVPKTEQEKRTFYQVNYEGTKNLCQALDSLGQLPKSFIFISTVAVYGIDEGQQIVEDHPLKGITPYAESKIQAEKWLKEWALKRGVTLSILRLPLIAGYNPPGNLGNMIRGIKSGRYLSIGKANVRKSIVWAEDIAKIIPKLSESGGIYNLTDGYHPSFGELEIAIAQAFNKKKPFKVPYWIAKSLAVSGDIIGNKFPINSDRLRKITSTLTFDDSKATKELGWRPTPVLDKIQEM